MDRFSNFIDLTSEQLAADESFQSYVFRKNKDDIRFWEDFIALHPGKQNEIDEAVEILAALAFRKNETTQQFKESELKHLLSSMSALEESDEMARLEKNRQPVRRPIVKHGFFATRRSRIAASAMGLLILLSAAIIVMPDFLDPSLVKYETAYGEHITVHLPDSSIVTLNGNTRLTLDGGWDDGKVREVWLDGEAFFEVKNKGKSGNARFVVHTHGMDVEVLGTKFNVFNRDDKANVVLNSGKVAVKIASGNDTSSVLMKPDEAVEFLRKDHVITKKKVNAELLTSWRNNILVFENTPLYQIGEIIEYTYGIEVIFDKNVNENEALAGTIPSENLDVLLTVLAKSSNLNIIRNRDHIIIEKMDTVSTKR